MNEWVAPALVIISSILGSSGLFAWISSRNKKTSAMDRLLLGLAYDKIATLGMHYIDRGWITKDEYEDFRKWLFDPYKEIGGNGVAEQIMNQVSNLPFRTHGRYAEIVRSGRTYRESA